MMLEPTAQHLENMMSLKKKTLDLIVAEAARKYASPTEAAAEIVDRCKADAGLMDELLGDAAMESAKARVYTARHAERSELRVVAPPPPVGKAQAARSAFLSSWKLSCGVTLGDATTEQLQSERERDYGIQAGYARNVAFYDALLGRMKPGEVVAKKWKDADAQRALDKIQAPARAAAE